MQTTERHDTTPDDALISIEIIYARPESVWRRALQLPQTSTVNRALIRSGFFDEFPEYSEASVKVGIYGQQCGLERLLNEHDRVEIYRPLVFDPMESRRRRARHRDRRRQEKLSRI